MAVDYTDQARIAYLSWVAAEDNEAELWVRTLREYARGEHPTYLTDRQEEFIGLKAKDADHLYAHNLCHLVIASVVERLHVTGFEPVDENDAEGTALATLAAQWWDENRMDARQDELHEAACRDGEAFLIVEWPDGAEGPKWAINYQYDGTQGVKLHRDPVTNDPLFASKRWQEYDPLRPDQRASATRLTLYFPDRVEKWISTRPGEGTRLKLDGRDVNTQWLEVNWKPYQGEDGKEPWPIWWTDTGEPGGAPLGLAVVGFLNPGGSEIADLLPIQDMLNKTDLDLIAAADTAGFRILWAAGVKAVIDKTTGTEAALTVGPGQLLRLDDVAASLNAIEPVDMERLIRTSKYWIESAAGITRTPQYLFEALGADQPSGESLKQREIGLLSKVERKQRTWGNCYEDVAHMSARLWNRYKMGEEAPIARLSTQWKAPEINNKLEDVQIGVQMMSLNVPDEIIWAEQLGWDQEMIDKAVALRDEQMQAQANIGGELLRAFEGGGGNGLPPQARQGQAQQGRG